MFHRKNCGDIPTPRWRIAPAHVVIFRAYPPQNRPVPPPFFPGEIENPKDFFHGTCLAISWRRRLRGNRKVPIHSPTQTGRRPVMKKELNKTGPQGQQGKNSGAVTPGVLAKALASPAIKRARESIMLSRASIQSEVHAVAAAKARSAMDQAAAAAAGLAKVAAAAKAAAAKAAARPAAAATLAVRLQRKNSA